MRKITAWLDGFTPLMDNITKEYGLFSAAVCGRIWRYEQGENQVCYASQQRIADDLGISLRTVAREIKRLIELNYIVDLTPDLKNKPHSYRTTERIGVEVNISAMPESHSTMPESHSHYDSESREDTSKIQVKKDSPNGKIAKKSPLILAMEHLETVFATSRGVPLPDWNKDPKGTQKTWRTPLKTIYIQCGSDEIRAEAVIRQAITRMHKDGLTFTKPIQIYEVAVSLLADGNQTDKTFDRYEDVY